MACQLADDLSARFIIRKGFCPRSRRIEILISPTGGNLAQHGLALLPAVQRVRQGNGLFGILFGQLPAHVANRIGAGFSLGHIHDPLDGLVGVFLSHVVGDLVNDLIASGSREHLIGHLDGKGGVRFGNLPRNGFKGQAEGKGEKNEGRLLGSDLQQQ